MCQENRSLQVYWVQFAFSPTSVAGDSPLIKLFEVYCGLTGCNWRPNYFAVTDSSLVKLVHYFIKRNKFSVRLNCGHSNLKENL